MRVVNTLGTLLLSGLLAGGCASSRHNLKRDFTIHDKLYHTTAQLRNSADERVFADRRIAARYYFTEKELQYAIDLSNAGRKDLEIYRSAQLGLDVSDLTAFEDTEKPDCVVLLTTEHYWKDGKETFTYIPKKKPHRDHFDLDQTNAFMVALREHYDVWYEFVYEQKDVQEARTMVKEPDLLIIAGHGLSKQIALADRYYFTPENVYISNWIDMLPKNSTLLLYSCLNGNGKDSLAMHCKKILEKKPHLDRRMFASIHSFGYDNFKVDAYYPLSVRFHFHIGEHMGDYPKKEQDNHVFQKPTDGTFTLDKTEDKELVITLTE